MFGLFKNKKVKMSKDLNQLKLRGSISKLEKTPKGSQFLLTQEKELKSGDIKHIYHKVKLGPIATEDSYVDLLNCSNEQVKVEVMGELFYADKPYCFAYKVQMV